MRIGVLGINHKLADLTLRERLAKACQRRFSRDTSLHGNHHLVLLSTCNRTEVYFSSEDLAATHSYLLGILRQDIQDTQDFDQKLYSYFGQDCFLHLCRVTAGLDSAIVAETEIQGQVKSAYERVLECCQLPYELHYLFQKALGIAKKVRGQLPAKPGLPGIEQAILQTGQHFFKTSHQPKVLFVGASEINQKIALFLKSKSSASLTLCNRSFAKGQRMAEDLGCSFAHLNALDVWHSYDWVIFGTKASQHLLSHCHVPKDLASPKLIIDLSVPRNVDPALSCHPAITLLNIDQINRRLKVRRRNMLSSLDTAETLINDSTDQHVRLFHQKEQNRLRLVAI